MKDIYVSKDKNSTAKKDKPKAASSKSTPPPPKTASDKKLQAELATEIGEVTQTGKPKTNNHPFASFAFYPHRTNFEIQAKEEKIILLLRRHPITNLPWILAAIALVVAPLFISPLLSSTLPPRFQFIAFLLWYLSTIAFIFEKFLFWYFNINVVTDERIIDFDFSHLIYKDISDAKTENIQDVRVVVSGVIRTMFNYGDVYVQTAAERPNFEFNSVPHPEQVSKILDKLRLAEEQEKLEGRVR